MKTSTTPPGATGTKLIKRALALSIVLLACLAGLIGCHADKGAVAEETPHFRLSDSLVSMIQVDTARAQELESELRLSGKITFDEDRIIKVYSPLGGVATEVKAGLGDRVEKGQVLAVIHSGEAAGYAQQRTAAEDNLLIAKKNLEAAEDMHASGVSSERDLLTAQRELSKAQAEVDRIRAVFSIYEIGSGSGYSLKAPMSGFIVERKLNPGMQIRPDNADNLFTISNLDEVWVTANLYEGDIAKVKPGYAAAVTTLSYGDKVFSGKVDKVDNVLDPETRVVKVRIRLPNPGYLLKPEMFASIGIRFRDGGSMEEIPSQAVIFDKSRNFVMVYRDRSDIETREINLYKTVSGKAFIASGLKDGERVISRYHLLVYDELNGG